MTEPGLEERLGRDGGLMARVKQSWWVKDDRSRGMGALAGGEKVCLPQSTHVRCMQELGWMQCLPLAFGRSWRQPSPSTKKGCQRSEASDFGSSLHGIWEVSLIPAAPWIPTGSLGLPPPAFPWTHFVSTHVGWSTI